MNRPNNPFAEDVLFEWKEPAGVRQACLSVEFRLWLLSLPIQFPIFAGMGLLLFAIKVWKNGHSLKEVPLWGLLLVSAAIAAIFSLSVLTKIILKRFSPVIIRLETNIIEKRRNGWGKEFSCGYNEIKSVALTKHNLAPKISAIQLITKTDDETFLGVPEDSIEDALRTLKEKVHGEPQAQLGAAR